MTSKTKNVSGICGTQIVWVGAQSKQLIHSCMNFGFESMAKGETGSFVTVVYGLITDINLARLRQCIHRIQNMMAKGEEEVLKEKLLPAEENSKKTSIKILLMSLLYIHHLVLRSPVASFATMPNPSAAILEN